MTTDHTPNCGDAEGADALAAFKEAGNRASYHFADDTTREWDKADIAKAEALAIFDAHPELHAQMREIAAGFLWTLKACGR